MKRRLLALAVPFRLFAAFPAAGEDLMDIYREAQRADPALAAARARAGSRRRNGRQARAQPPAERRAVGLGQRERHLQQHT